MQNGTYFTKIAKFLYENRHNFCFYYSLPWNQTSLSYTMATGFSYIIQQAVAVPYFFLRGWEEEGSEGKIRFCGSKHLKKMNRFCGSKHLKKNEDNC